MKSGRRIEELAAAPAPPAPARRLRPGSVAGAVKGPAPEGLAPQLAAPVSEPPAGDDWLHEIKLDGYRTLAFRDGAAVRLVTRGGLDWTHRYGDLADAFRSLPCREAIVDGEIVVLDDRGISRFALLQDALSRGARTELVFFAFDLLRLDGWTLTGAPLAKRKALLAQLLAGATGRSAIQYSDHVRGGGRGFYDQVSALGLEGVVSKRAEAVLSARAVEDLGEGEGEARRRLRRSRVSRCRTRPRGSGRWRSASGRGASSAIAARSGPGSTLARSSISTRDWRRSRTGGWRSTGRRRMSIGCGRSIRRGCSTRTSPPTGRCGTASSSGCASRS